MALVLPMAPCRAQSSRVLPGGNAGTNRSWQIDLVGKVCVAFRRDSRRGKGEPFLHVHSMSSWNMLGEPGGFCARMGREPGELQLGSHCSAAGGQGYKLNSAKVSGW